MAAPTVAVIATGAMGAAVGGVLAHHGARVVTNLSGRSEASRIRAGAHGIADLGSDEAVAEAADIFLSILPPAEAVTLAGRMAVAAPSTGHPVYVDFNAIAPQTMARVEAVLAPAGYAVVDGGIIGAPPTADYRPRLYVSGPERAAAMALAGFGLDMREAGPGIGDASALKLCYAALTKGLSGLFIEAAAAAAAYGVDGVLAAEWAESQDSLTRRLAATMPQVHGKAARFVGEMREMAIAFGAVGLTPAISEGMAELYAAVAAARERDPSLASLEHPELSAALARALAEMKREG